MKCEAQAQPRRVRAASAVPRALQALFAIALSCVTVACSGSRAIRARPDARDASVNPPKDAGVPAVDAAVKPGDPVFSVQSDIVCPLLGKGAHNPATLQPELSIYGTDMGISVVLGKRMYLVFGDTWTRPVCDGTDEPYASLHSDDLLGSLPLQPAPDPSACLEIEFPTTADDASKFQPMTLEHRGERVDLLALGVASAAFAYEDKLYALFNPYREVSCASNTDCVAPAICTLRVCTYQALPAFPPRILGVSAMDGERPNGSFTGFAELDVVSFSNVTSHTVNGIGADSDYDNDAPSELLLFGRSSYLAGLDASGTAQPPDLFLLRQQLAPLIADERFSPQYFAGLDDQGAPRWSANSASALPITPRESEVAALDGQAQPVPIFFPGNMAVSTIPAFGPQHYRWLLVYGGRSPAPVDYYETDHDERLGLFLRLARDPWGPWTAPRQLWTAYSPEGPGLVYRPDWDGVASDEGRGPRSCDVDLPYEDIGVEYSPQVIERFSEVHGDQLTLHWLMSIWNPYRVIQMRSEITLRD